MTRTVPDTSVWIRFLREGEAGPFVRRGIRSRTLYLASVVAHELYVGAATREDKRDLDRIAGAFAAAGLTVTPTFTDWITAGILLDRYRRLRGSIDPRVHLNDVLVVLSAAQLGATVTTWNVRDMSRWNRLLSPSRRIQVQVPPPLLASRG